MDTILQGFSCTVLFLSDSEELDKMLDTALHVTCSHLVKHDPLYLKGYTIMKRN